MSYGFYGEEKSQDQHQLDFKALFNQQDFNVVKLLNTHQILQQLRKDNEIFTQQLIKHPEILVELFGICFRPNQYENPHLDQLNNDLTYKAIEILDNLTEELSQFLMKPQSDPQEPCNDEVVTDQIQQSTKPNPVFLQCTALLKDKKPLQQTPMAYFSKVIISICYQKPKQIIEFFAQSHNHCLFQHFYSRSILQIMQRLLECEEQPQFFESQKVEMVRLCQQKIEEENDEQLSVLKLENYLSMMDNLLDRMSDRFDKAKFSSLAKQILNTKSNTSFLLAKVQQFPHSSEILRAVFNNLDKFLGFSTVNRSLNQQSSHYKMFDNLDNSIEQIKINEQMISQIHKFITKSTEKVLDGNKTIFCILAYLRLLKSALNIDKQLINQISRIQFINQLLGLVKRYPTNNIMHNLIKDVIVGTVSNKKMVEILFNQECGFLHMLSQITVGNSIHIFQNQSYTIFQAVIKSVGEQTITKLCQPNYLQTIQANVLEKQKFYSYQAGGNARKESSCWGDSSADMVFDRLALPSFSKIDKDKHPEDNHTYLIESNQQHWFDCGGLPLDSDQSREETPEGLHERMKSPRSIKSPRSPVSPRSPQDNKCTLQINSFQQISKEQVKDEEMLKKKEQTKKQRQIVSQSFQTYLNYQIQEILSELE